MTSALPSPAGFGITKVVSSSPLMPPCVAVEEDRDPPAVVVVLAGVLALDAFGGAELWRAPGLPAHVV